MHATSVSRRLAGAAGAVALPALTALALAMPASTAAATIYACVNKRTGAARVFYKEPKCKKGQLRLAWNTQGPAGKNGANGKNGSTGKTGATGKNGNNGVNGTNGAVAGYSTSKTASVAFTGQQAVPILSKTVPAGNYIVFAKTVLSASSTTAVRAVGVCELLVGGASPAADTSGWDTGLAEVVAGSFIGEATLSLQAAVSVSAATTLSLVCSDDSPSKTEPTLAAASSQLAAIQTSQNS
jgi:hypothetical protein